VEAKITRLTKFGAFAMLASGIEGLIHISEISDEHIGHPKEVLHEDDNVTLRIIKIEPESHRIGLSLRRVESLAFADMDMKMLEKELDGTDIQVTTADEAQAPAEANQGEPPKTEVNEQVEVEASEPVETEPEAAAEEPTPDKAETVETDTPVDEAPSA
jgi:small subunit ribosomal protein S1